MDPDTKVTAVPRSPLRKLCKCRPQICAPRSLWRTWLSCDLRFLNCCDLISVFTQSALKRSRRTRRYAIITRTSLRRARTSTATARRWTKTKATAARRGPAFTSTACLLCDTSSSVSGRLAHSSPCDSTSFKKQPLYLHNQTLSSLGIFFCFVFQILYLSTFLVFFVINLALDSFCTKLVKLSVHNFYFLEKTCICTQKDRDEQRSQRKGNTDS